MEKSSVLAANADTVRVIPLH